MQSKQHIRSLPPFKPCNLTVKQRKMSFDEWLMSPVQNMGHNVTNGTKDLSHKEYIVYFYRNIEKILESNGVTINDKKRFKNEIASFIYRTSDEPVNA
jgi:hypothetical protein